jgi:nucleoside-diphosphate-sugar epimerase
MSDNGTSRRALVTGVAGFIGSHLAERLLERGIEVIGVDRLSDYYDENTKMANLAAVLDEPGFRFVQADLNDEARPGLLDGVGVVYHLAGQPGVRPSWGRTFEIYAHDNILATQALLEAAKEAPIERFVYASSSSVYGNAERFPTRESDLPNPVSPYGVTKLAAEHLCQLYAQVFGMPTVSLRYFSVYGPRQRPDMAFHRFINAAIEGNALRVFGDGRQTRDFTYVDDIVDATIDAGDRGVPGEVYNVAGGSRTSVLEVAALLERLLGLSVQLEHVDAARGDARDTAADTSKAARDLGFSPDFPLERGLAAQVAAVRATARF